MAQGNAYPYPPKTMAHTAHPGRVGHAERRTFDQTGLFVTLCRGLSIISGGFLLGSNQGWGALVGLGLGLGAWLATEVGIRRANR